MVECPDLTQMTVLYVLSMLNPPCVLVHHVHTYICLGLQVKWCVLKRTCKGETRSYCLSALATLWRIACTGTVLWTITLLNSLVGGAQKKKKKNVWHAVLMLTGEGAGQQCGMGNAKSPPTVECFSSLSQTEEPKDFSGKSSPLCMCA